MKTLFAPAVRLMNWLKYPQKFLLVGLVLELPLGIVLSQYITQINLVVDFAAREQLGLQYNMPLVTFLQDVEQQAGLVRAYVAGNDAFRAKIVDLMTNKQAKVEDDILAVSAADNALSGTLSLGGQWNNIKTEWNLIKGQNPTSTSDAATAYDSLIHQTLLLVTEVGNKSNLILDPDIDTYYVMDALVNKIPTTSGDLSDLRGFSTAAAAQKRLSTSDRTRLIILIGLIRSEQEAQSTTIDYIMSYNPSLALTVKATFNSVAAQVNAVLDHVNQVFLTSTGEQSQDTPVDVDPSIYFIFASNAIDSTFNFYSLLGQKENDLLEKRIDAKSSQRNAIVILSLVALLVATYLFIAFYMAVRGLVEHLEVSSKRLVTGLMSGELVLDNRDELGQLVTAFNTIVNELLRARDQAVETGKALSQSEGQLRSILDTSPIPIAVVNTQNTIYYMNPVAISMLGDKWRLFSNDASAAFGVDQGDQTRIREQLEKQGYTRDTEIHFQASPGTPRSGLVSIQPFHYLGQSALLVAVVDITQLKQAQESERQQHSLTEALLDSAMAITSSLQINHVVEQILNNLKRVVPHDVANVMILEGEQVWIPGERHYLADGTTHTLADRRIPFNDQDYPNLAIQTDKPVIVRDVEANPRFRQIFQAPDLKSFLFLPIVVGQVAIGFINLGSRQTNYFNEEHAAYLQIFVLQVGIAIQNAQLFKQTKTIASLEERQRLARELHDSVAQSLFSANLIVEGLPRLIDEHSQKTRQYLNDLHQLTQGAMAEMRLLLVELRSETFAQIDLNTLLTQLCAIFTSRTTIEVDKAIDAKLELTPEAKFVFYRIAQEALNNIAKHASPTHVSLSLSVVANVITMRIFDDGTGFDPSSVPADHLGLKIMKERAEQIQAVLKLNSQPGKGVEMLLSSRFSP